MPLRAFRPVVAAFVFVCLYVGCVTLRRTPEARFYVLRPVAPAATDAAAGPGGLVGVLPIRLPGFLDRPQVVTSVGAQELRIDEYARWAEPLAAAVERVVAQDLAAALPGHRVVRFPWPARSELRCRVVIEVEAFSPQSNGRVRLAGRWTVLAPRDESRLDSAPFELTRGPFPAPAGVLDAGTASAAMSELLADLADRIAEGIRGLGPAPGSAPVAEPDATIDPPGP